MNWPDGDTNKILKEMSARFPSGRPDPLKEHLPLLMRDIAEQLVRISDWQIAQHKQQVNLNRLLGVIAAVAVAFAIRLLITP
ncbi:MAG: hypothetical protein ABMA14_12925 [Hyphomonadaceae bacterium]